MSKMQRAIAIICNKGKGGRLQSCGKHEKIRKHHPPLPLPSPAISGFHSKQSKHLLNQMHRHDYITKHNMMDNASTNPCGKTIQCPLSDD